MVGVVEAMHAAIGRQILPGTPAQAILAGATGAIYGGIRAITRSVGGGIDALLSPLSGAPGEAQSNPAREAMLAAINGILGDHLASTRNPLAIPMRLRHRGRPLHLERRRLKAAIPRGGGRLLVLAHGLCMNDLQWTRHGHNHGRALAADLGWTPVYLHYNTGLHVSTNGRAFAALLETLVDEWPERVRELAIVGHSSGGLLARSALHYGAAAGHRWPRLVRRLFFLGTPHHGSALERAGNWVNVMLNLTPYSSPLARIAGIRSAGITDLRYGNLVDEDWQGTDRFHHTGDRRRPLPLPKRVRCFAIAASADHRYRLDGRCGDGLVDVDSALGRHPDPSLHLSFSPSRQWVGRGMGHWDLLSHPEIYGRIREWIAS
ncbi:MAG: GPI inositol-deacylase [Acidobacteriia bacterium]|nr:GPI inositol-deacylase [Terriglobia bacterium]